MYCTTNFPTKKALKEAVKQRLRWLELHQTQDACKSIGMNVGAVLSHKEFPDGEPSRVTFYQPNNMFGIRPCKNGVETVEGPHNPKPHTWYARCTIKDSEVVRVS